MHYVMIESGLLIICVSPGFNSRSIITFSADGLSIINIAMINIERYKNKESPVSKYDTNEKNDDPSSKAYLIIEAVR